MSETVQANDGAQIPLSSTPQSFSYSGGFISSITVIYQGKTYVQTFINDGTNIIYITGWINPNFPPPNQIMVSQSGVVMTSQDDNVMLTES